MPPDQLQEALDRLQSLPISPEGRKVIADTLKAAANPDAERIDVVISTLDKKRRGMIEKTAKGLRELSADVQARGRKRLMDISESEWQRLTDESTN